MTLAIVSALGWLSWSGAERVHGGVPSRETRAATPERTEPDPELAPPVRLAPEVSRSSLEPATAEATSAITGCLEKARAIAARKPVDRNALDELAQVEAEALAVFEGVFRRAEKLRGTLSADEWAAKKQACQDDYKEILQLSDQAVGELFTPEEIDAVGWRDLLAQPGRWKWSKLQGFDVRFAGGALELVGPDASEHSEGLLTIGDGENWHDFDVEMTVTIASGECSLFFRLPPVYQKNVEQRDLMVGEDALEAGTSYDFTYRVLGSTLTEVADGTPSTSKISWTQVRKGAFGISIPSGSNVRITRLRARVLR